MNATLRGFVRKEMLQALRDPRMRFVLFGIPFVQTTLFGLALSMEVRNARLAVVHAPGDRLVRRIAERSYASGWFKPVDPAGRDPFELIRSGAAEAVLVALPPRARERRAEGQAGLQLLVDATNTLRAQGMVRYVRAILNEIVRETAPANAAEAPVSFSVRTLFNPAMRSAVFLVPGVMCMILCVSTIIMTAMSLSQEKEAGTFEMLIAAPVSTMEVLLGKTVPFILLGLLDVPIVLAAGLGLFRVPFVGGVWALGLASLLFVTSTVSIGMLISTFARDQQQAMMASFLFLFPAMLLSGLFFPLENMPPLLHHLTWLNPLRHYIVLLRNIMLKGGDPHALSASLLPLVLITAAAVWASVRRFHQTLN